MINFLALIFSVVIICWLSFFFYISDFSVKFANVKKFKKLLVIFPHPDDEVLSAGGLLKLLAQNGTKTTLLTLTKGEKGNPSGVFDLKLKKIRTKETGEASKILEIDRLILQDLGDGEIVNKQVKVKKIISKTIEEEKPDLVITYDRSGLYGHEDHMVVSEIVTSLIKNKYKNISLWYTTYPKRDLDMAKLPEHMAKDLNFKNKRTLPTNKVFIGLNIFNKLRALYAYKSQYSSYRNGLPIKFIPLWFVYSITLFEYFHEVN